MADSFDMNLALIATTRTVEAIRRALTSGDQETAYLLTHTCDLCMQSVREHLSEPDWVSDAPLERAI